MAGHSKWANIKHRKGAQDAARAKIFAKFSKEIMVAAAQGGPDLDTNSALRLAVQKAKARSMPKKNIENAIAKATGAGADASSFKEIVYGGNVGGVSFLVNCLSNNANRVASNVQMYFNKANGSVSGASAVTYIFDRKGILEWEAKDVDEDEIMMIALDAGAEDFEKVNGSFFAYCNPASFSSMKEALENKGITEFKTAEVTYEANQEIKLPKDKAERILAFIDKLEDDEDIQEVFHNLDAASLDE